MELLRQTYVLRIRMVAAGEPETDSTLLRGGDVERKGSPHERFYCSLQAISTDEIHYFASLEETVVFLRNNALAFRFRPT